MKKIYSFMLATLCVAGTAVAVGSALGTPKTADLKVNKELQTASAKKMNSASLAVNAVAAEKNLDAKSLKTRKVARKADASTSIEGTWTFALGDYYFQNSVGEMEVDFEATLDGNEVTFEDPTGQEFPMVATYDAQAGTLTFEREFLGTAEGYYVYQQPFVFNWDTEDLDDATVVGFINGISIEFDADNGISWPAYTNAAGTNQKGYFGIYDLLGAEKAVEWIAMEDATFNENILYSLFTREQNNSYAELTVEENPVTPGIYRVLNPLKDLYAELGFDAVSPTMTIDATDPDNVLVGFTSSSINGGSDGLYIYFNYGWYNANYGAQLDPAFKCTLTTDAEGYTVITFPYHSFLVMANATGDLYYGSAYPSVLKFKKPSNAVEGNMTAQLDMNQGMEDEPDLLEPENFDVTAVYDVETGKLTINNFAELNPVVFTVDVENATAVAEGKQLAYHEEIEDDGETYTFDYYYGDVTTQSYGMNGKIYSTADGKVELTVDPWGEAMDWDDGLYFMAAYYNTVVTLDLEIEGLPEKPNYDYASIEGEWVFPLNGHYLGQYSLGEFEGKFTATLDENTVTFESADSPFNIVAEFTDGYTLSFKQVAVGNPEATYILTQSPYVNDYNASDVDELQEKEFTAEYNAEDGTITFPANSGLRYGYFDAAGELSYWDDAFDFAGVAEKIFDVTEVVGNYTWQILPTDLYGNMTGDVIDLYVTVKQTEDDPTHFTVEENGYTNYFNDQVLAFTYNAASKMAQFDQSYAGEIEGQAVWMSAFVLNEGNGDIIRFIEPMQEYGVLFDKENGFTFPGNSGFAWYFSSSASAFEPSGDVYRAFYVNPDFKYSGVEAIEAAGEGAVRYFNMQGVEVKNPAKGSILIKVEGGKASKQIVK